VLMARGAKLTDSKHSRSRIEFLPRLRNQGQSNGAARREAKICAQKFLESLALQVPRSQQEFKLVRSAQPGAADGGWRILETKKQPVLRRVEEGSTARDFMSKSRSRLK
jgi:hypothetical protein